MGLGGLGSPGLGVVAGRIWIYVGGGGSPGVCWVVGWSARSVVWPSEVVVVLVYGGLWAGGVGCWAAAVVVGVVLGVVVVVMRVLVVVAVVVELVVVVAPWARPLGPPAFQWDVGVGHRLQPLGPHGLVDSRGG